MKRDLDLVRKILLACEASPSNRAPALEFAGYAEEQVGFHVHLMISARLLEGVSDIGAGGSGPLGLATAITWDGYEFLEASRDDARWVTARMAAEAAGALSLEVLKGTLIALASAAVKKAVGL